ncbi:MAG: sensor domain-containing protein [Propionibacteriales bacterium]|nr:sensor domain-containing protein [Propionibacteriales bacterium]
MSSFPDAWTAVRGRPWRFLGSAWPWRSLAYLATTVPVGVATVVALFVVVGIGLLTVVVVVGLLVLTAVPTIATGVAALERRRVGLVLPGAARESEGSLRERLRASRDLPVSWSEVGYAVLLSLVLWVVDAVVLSTTLTVSGSLLLAPLLVRADAIDVGIWRVDTTGEANMAVPLGVVAFVLAAYVVTALAVAQAALTQVLLDPQQGRLAKAVQDLRRSRVDLVDAFETERRRIERDLHDGVQQRLVALTMTLGQAELDVADGPGLALLRRAHQQAEEALDELRSTVRGIHPRVLVDHGLAAAVHEIADRSTVPVQVDIALAARLPGPVETAAYFVVSEALTNATRHASARLVRVQAWTHDDRLVLSVADDGVGGAVVGGGTGLAGLALRLEALDGLLTVTSPPGGPTEVRMECPIDAA